VEVVGRYHLGIGEQADPTAELAEIADEPLSSGFPIDYELRTTPVRNWLKARLTDADRHLPTPLLEDEFESVYADLSRKSRVPAGAFAADDKSKLKQQVLALGENLYPYIGQMRAARRLFPAVRVGTAMDDFAETGGVHLDFNPVSIHLPGFVTNRLTQTVQLNGSLPWVWQTPDHTWHCLVVTGSNRKSKFADKYVVGPLLTLMAISAGGEPYPWSDVNCMAVHVVYRQHVLNLDYRLDPGPCADYLAGLMGDFFTPAPLVWLPFEVVSTRAKLRRILQKDAVDEADRRLFYESMQAAMKAEADMMAELTGAVVAPDILDRARRRFKVFLA
jgi:hypothetical protein